MVKNYRKKIFCLENLFFKVHNFTSWSEWYGTNSLFSFLLLC